MTKFSNKLKNPWFWPILGPFFAILSQKIFSQKALPPTTSNEYLAPCQISEKTNDTIPRKCLEEGRKDRQTLFYRTLPVTARDPKTY